MWANVSPIVTDKRTNTTIPGDTLEHLRVQERK